MEEVQFRWHRDGALGGIISDKFDNRPVDNDNEAVKYYTVPLETIFQRVNVPRDVDYLSLDVEGT